MTEKVGWRKIRPFDRLPHRFYVLHQDNPASGPFLRNLSGELSVLVYASCGLA